MDLQDLVDNQEQQVQLVHQVPPGQEQSLAELNTDYPNLELVEPV
jgi:hypothetical protein